MKKVVLLFLFFYSFLYPVELIPQKIMLSLSKESPNFKMELIIQKRILSWSKSKKDIYFFSDDQTELSGYGISQVNAKILFSIRNEGNFYNLRLLDITKETNIITNIIFSKGNFIKEVDLITEEILNLLSSRYPPKEKRQLVTIETKKKRVSEFQKEKPEFSVEANFSLDRFKLSEIDISFSQYGMNFNLEREAIYSFAPSIKLEFEYMWFLISLGGKVSVSEEYNYYFYLVPAVGFFGNLFFIGPFVAFDGGRLNGFGTNFIISSSETNFLDFPAMEYYRLLLGFYLRFNVTKNYYFSLGFGFPLLGRLSLLSEERVMIEFNEGSVSGNMDFNFRLIEKLFLSFQIKFYESAVKREWDSSKYPPPVRIGSSEENDFYLRSFRVGNTVVGLGVKYEF